MTTGHRLVGSMGFEPTSRGSNDHCKAKVSHTRCLGFPHPLIMFPQNGGPGGIRTLEYRGFWLLPAKLWKVWQPPHIFWAGVRLSKPPFRQVRRTSPSACIRLPHNILIPLPKLLLVGEQLLILPASLHPRKPLRWNLLACEGNQCDKIQILA